MFGDGGVLQLSLGLIWNKNTWDSLPGRHAQIAVDARKVFLDHRINGANAGPRFSPGAARGG